MDVELEYVLAGCGVGAREMEYERRGVKESRWAWGEVRSIEAADSGKARFGKRFRGTQALVDMRCCRTRDADYGDCCATRSRGQGIDGRLTGQEI